MPKVRKAKRSEVELIEGTSLRGVDTGGLPSDPLRASGSPSDEFDEPPVLIEGATLTGINLTPRGFGYEIKLLVPLSEEEKLGPFRRLAFQQLVNLNVSAASWADLDDEA